MSSSDSQQKLLVIGLCGESIFVDWNHQDTVKVIKDRAFAAASIMFSADGFHYPCNLVKGISPEQLCLVFGQPDDAVKLQAESPIHDCLHAYWR